MQTPTRPITESESSAPLDRAYLRAPRVPVINYWTGTFSVRRISPWAVLATGLTYADARSLAADFSNGLLGGTYVVDVVDEVTGETVETFR